MIRVDSPPVQTAFALALLAALPFGCRPSAEPPSLNVEAVAADQFDADSATWSKQAEVTPADQKLLGRFFQSHPAWTDSTELEGTPVVYTHEDRRRFYWIRPAQDEPIWTCIHFEKKRFRVSHGAGPLDSAAH
ncbi:hypothetical protein [Blastopirellula retiformator]|uniref:Uncharacterized protein n=1 Tax=Blastopirellula retiformator TaxID=2527970 RepID=A0A5C5V9Y4_9BACT|nr:hypothetical protein [Blastopirellula retiformator]TWT34763.1 hypothetical protein Enr8_21770 [Blastopirellula retiformator]